MIIKAALPTSLKLKFKIICTQKGLSMSQVLIELIRSFIQADRAVANFNSDLSEEDNEYLKGYIPESLKIQFKVFCTQKAVTMRASLYQLVNQWVKTEGNY